MKRAIKTELYRAFTGAGLYISAAIGLAICAVHFFVYLIPASELFEKSYSNPQPMIGFDWLFSAWMGGNSYNVCGYILFLLLPILSATAHADSFCADRASGYINGIISRVSRRDYYTAKYIASFVAGGTVIAVPLLLSLAISSMMLPSMIPQMSSGYPVGNQSIMCGLFYSHPYVYNFLYILIDFVFGGITAAVSLVVAVVSTSRILSLISPFIFYVFFNSVCELFGAETYSPLYYLVPGSGLGRAGVIATEALMCLAATAAIYISRGVKSDA